MSYQISDSRDKIYQFLRSHPVASLATVTPQGQPHVATVYTSIDEDLNIYFISKQNTTKSKNIEASNQVALAVTDAHSLQTVQAVGVAERVDDPNVSHQVLARVTAIASSTADSAQAPVDKLAAGDYVVYVVRTSSLRLGEFNRPDINDLSDLFEKIENN